MTAIQSVELRRLRERVDWDSAKLAFELGVPERKVRAWEGGARVPERIMTQTRWLTALEQQERVLQASGLPDCDWLVEWEKRDVTKIPLEEFDKHFESLERHAKSCPVCIKRNEYLRVNAPPLPPPPVPSTRHRLTFNMIELLESAWKGFAGFGPLFILAILGALAGAIRVLPHWEPLAVLVYLLAIISGATVALWSYQLTDGLRRFGAIGRWLSRCLAGVPGCVAFTLIFAVAGFAHELSRSGHPSSLERQLLIGTLMGLTYGTFWPLAEFFHRH